MGQAFVVCVEAASKGYENFRVVAAVHPLIAALVTKTNPFCLTLLAHINLSDTAKIFPQLSMLLYTDFRPIPNPDTKPTLKRAKRASLQLSKKLVLENNFLAAYTNKEYHA
jgi:hypothetical protein